MAGKPLEALHELTGDALAQPLDLMQDAQEDVLESTFHQAQGL